MKMWQTIDKSQWPERGEWDHEPDKAQWIDEVTGLDCLIVRTCSHGGLCGYVGVPKTHPLYGDEYDNAQNLDVHGGLTFSARCSPSNDPSRGICHTGEIAHKDVWWLGFDCAHYDDISPGYFSMFKAIDNIQFSDDEAMKYHNLFNSGIGQKYRNFDYVKNEVESLAKQIMGDL